ncbi:hypothetical protein [Prosthecobacter sp.]|uniref:hypothetical protein n=1 Tax=Prosthecobacter sp. TaxID=1965333 RepID=UPI003782D390
MNWRILKAFPKYVIALGVVVLSTGLFGIWWWLKRPAPYKESTKTGPVPALVASTKAKADALPAKLGWLALVGSDLYDISTGELLFKNWLKGIPLRVFYYPESRNLMVQAERGIMRFGLDGKQDGVMGVDTPPAFTNDGSQAMYVKDGDIWVAGIDWTAFKFVNERQATRYGQFSAPYFSANLPLASEKACLVNQQNKLLRVDLSTGDLKQMKLPLQYNMKRRSPDCKIMLGEEEGQLFVFDIDKTEAAMFPNTTGRVSDYQWLNNEACAILSGKTLRIFDRSSGKIGAIALPIDCQRISMPSLNGRYVLCAGSSGQVQVDLKTKKAERVDIQGNHFAWVNDDTFIFSREIPDMKLRGTWLKTIGSEPQRVMEEPYPVGYDKSAPVALMRELGVVVFATRNALFRMKTDGTELREIAKLNQPVGRIQAVEMWGR